MKDESEIRRRIEETFRQSDSDETRQKVAEQLRVQMEPAILALIKESRNGAASPAPRTIDDLAAHDRGHKPFKRARRQPGRGTDPIHGEGLNERRKCLETRRVGIYKLVSYAAPLDQRPRRAIEQRQV